MRCNGPNDPGSAQGLTPSPATASGPGAGPRRRALRAVSALGAVLLLDGCGKSAPVLPPPPPPPVPKVLWVELQAAADVNPDGRGRPSPVVVRVYELKASAPFESADFLSLYDKDQSVLGGDLVARDEFTLSPGQSTTLRRVASDSRFLAVMAAFRDLDSGRWRAVVPLAAGLDNLYTVRLEQARVQILKRSVTS